MILPPTRLSRRRRPHRRRRRRHRHLHHLLHRLYLLILPHLILHQKSCLRTILKNIQQHELEGGSQIVLKYQKFEKIQTIFWRALFRLRVKRFFLRRF